MQHPWEEKCVQSFGGRICKKEPLGDLDKDMRIILKGILKKQNGSC
jgi:hypothetical protein